MSAAERIEQDVELAAFDSVPRNNSHIVEAMAIVTKLREADTFRKRLKNAR